MSLTINIPEWFGWIAVGFLVIYALVSMLDTYWKWDEYQNRIRKNNEQTY